jgi:hypothetical protein
MDRRRCWPGPSIKIRLARAFQKYLSWCRSKGKKPRLACSYLFVPIPLFVILCFVFVQIRLFRFICSGSLVHIRLFKCFCSDLFAHIRLFRRQGL